MQKLMAGDSCLATVVRPEIDAALATNGIEGSDVPKSVFLPEGTKWLEKRPSARHWAQVVRATAAMTNHGVHGLGLAGTSVDGTELTAESSTAVSAAETPEVEVEVQNQGESTENGITVSVTINGGNTLQQDISSIGVGETQSVTIPLTPAPKGQATLEVDVQTVPGEQVSSNNKATYTVEFE